MIPKSEQIPAFLRSRQLRQVMRLLFRWKGIRALAHLVRRHLYWDAWVEIDDFDEDLRFYCHLNEHIGSFMYWRGSYSFDQLVLLDRMLRDDMVFIDVGANQGEFTLFAAKRLPQGRVIALEPMKEMYDRLVRNVTANRLTNVLALPVGLWSDRTRLALYQQLTAFEDGSIHEGLGTVFPDSRRGAPVEEIECTTLDALLTEYSVQRVDGMKIDIEGAELQALKGAVDTIRRHVPWLLIEVDRRRLAAAGVEESELLDWLGQWYRMEMIVPGGRTRPLDRSRLKNYQNILCHAR
jgi:FkbM family methyltransferase